MNLKPTDDDPSDPKIWGQLLSEVRDLKARNAILNESAKNTHGACASLAHADEELRRVNRALTVLSKCKAAMIKADDEGHLLNDICDIIVGVGGYRLAWIGYIEDDEHKTVRPVARAGHDEGYVDNLKIALNDPVTGNGPTGISLKTGKPFGSRNVRADKAMAPWQEEALNRGYLSTLNVPIVYEKQVIGALVIYSGTVDAFDEGERGLLFEFAQTLAYGITAIRDRARRAKAEDALHESEERLDYALKAAREGIWDWNTETDEAYYSPRYKEMLGYSEGEIEPNASAWMRLMHPDDRDRALRVVDAVMHSEREYEMEFRMLHKDGHYVDILSRGYPIRRGPGGPITRIVGTHLDVTERNRMAEELRRARDGLEARVRERTADLQRTNDELNVQIAERRQAEEALKESEARFRQLADNSPISMAINDKDDNITYLNKKFIEVFGYTREDIPDLSAWWHRAYPDPAYQKDAIERWEKGVEVAVREAKEIGPLDFTVTCKDGSVRYTEISGTPIGDRELVLLQDVTERKRAEEARERLLRDVDEQRARLQAILDSLPVGVWISDATGKMLLINDIAKTIWGGKAPRSETIADYEEYRFWWADTGELVKAEDMPLARAVTRGEMIKDRLIITERFDGIKGTGLISGAPIRDPQGNVIGGIVIVQDISGLKRTEEELKAAKAQVELYLDLMGHDINNMNQSAMGYLELALETLEADGKIGLDGKLFIEKPLQAIQSSSTLIENVRKLQHLTTDGIKTMPVDLHDLFDELRANDFHASDKDVTVNIEQIPHYQVEGSRLLGDVFYNLINNAVKHSMPGAPVTVDIKVKRIDENGRAYYRCTIDDNGPGIPDEAKPKLFYRFHRGKTKAHGKGLGLYIVRTLVEGYHGKVWAEDRVPGDHGKGARFVVVLPAAEK